MDTGAAVELAPEIKAEVGAEDTSIGHVVKPEPAEDAEEEAPEDKIVPPPVAPSNSPQGEERVLRPLPPPASTDSWRAAYEARRQEALERGATTETNSVPAFPAFLTKKSDEKTLLSTNNSSEKVSGVKTVSVAPRPDNVDLSAQLQVMSNSKRKKMQEAELKKTSVLKLIKKVKVDMNRPPADWASEYEARKSAALSSIVAGTAEPNVGSMTAFHTGLYGKELQEEGELRRRQQSLPAPVRIGDGAPHHNPGLESSSSASWVRPSPPARPSPPERPTYQIPATLPRNEPNNPVINRPNNPAQTFARPSILQCSISNSYNTEDQSNEFRVVGSAAKRKPPPSPLDLVRMEQQNPNVFVDLAQHNISTAEEAEDEEQEEQDYDQGLEASSSSQQLSNSPKKKVTMASLFRQVRCDAKRSSEDWQAAYEARKRARIEEDGRSRANQIMTGKLRFDEAVPFRLQVVPADPGASGQCQRDSVVQRGQEPLVQRLQGIASGSSSARQQFGARNPGQVSSQSFGVRSLNPGSLMLASGNSHTPGQNQFPHRNQSPSQPFMSRNANPVFAARNQNPAQHYPSPRPFSPTRNPNPMHARNQNPVLRNQTPSQMLSPRNPAAYQVNARNQNPVHRNLAPNQPFPPRNQHPMHSAINQSPAQFPPRFPKCGFGLASSNRPPNPAKINPFASAQPRNHSPRASTFRNGNNASLHSSPNSLASRYPNPLFNPPQQTTNSSIPNFPDKHRASPSSQLPLGYNQGQQQNQQRYGQFQNNGSAFGARGSSSNQPGRGRGLHSSGFNNRPPQPMQYGFSGAYPGPGTPSRFQGNVGGRGFGRGGF